MKKVLLLLFLLPLSALAKRKKTQAFVAMNSYEFTHPKYDSTVLDVSESMFGSKVVVRKKDSKEKYAAGMVWGFRDKANDAYRVFNSELYQVKQADTLCIYEQHHGKRHKFYFSLGLDGHIYRLDTRPLNNVFGETNHKFLSSVKKNIKWYQSYESYNRKAKTYRIVALYKQTVKVM